MPEGHVGMMVELSGHRIDIVGKAEGRVVIPEVKGAFNGAAGAVFGGRWYSHPRSHQDGLVDAPKD